MEKVILTVSRQYGSGGDEVAYGLAKALGVEVYDKHRISDIAKEKGYADDIFDASDDQPTSSLLYSLVMGLQSGSADDLMSAIGHNNVFAIQSNIISGLAAEGSGVFVGCCADYILRNKPNVINIFISAGMDYKSTRVAEEKELGELAAIDYINKKDRRRGALYSFNTNRAWQGIGNYDLVISLDKIGKDKAIKLILDYIEMV